MHPCEFCKMDMSNDRWQLCMRSSDYLAGNVVEMTGSSGEAMIVVVLSGS